MRRKLIFTLLIASVLAGCGANPTTSDDTILVPPETTSETVGANYRQSQVKSLLQRTIYHRLQDLQILAQLKQVISPLIPLFQVDGPTSQTMKTILILIFTKMVD